jgi:hypothetical protein
VGIWCHYCGDTGWIEGIKKPCAFCRMGKFVSMPEKEDEFEFDLTKPATYVFIHKVEFRP